MSIETGAASTAGQDPSGIKFVSNSVDDMHSPGIGPEQALVRINSLRYCMFDYNGKMAHDPMISARALCTPLDGANDSKDFEIDWTVGAKLADFAIMMDGKKLGVVGSRVSLTNTSNFALFQQSLKSHAYDTNLFNGEEGLAAFDGAEIVVRRITVKRENMPNNREQGQAQQGAAPREDKYYTCLKIDKLPGEGKRPGGAKKATAASTPAAAKSAPAAKVAAASNGNGAGDYDAVAIINGILKDSAGSIEMKNLKLSLFNEFKKLGKPVAECQTLAKQYGSEDYLVSAAMEKDMPWAVENDTLTAQ
jgi:hypothetical protein